MRKLSNVVKNEAVKQIEYNESLKKVGPIQTSDTSNLVKKMDYGTKASDTEKKLLIMGIAICV